MDLVGGSFDDECEQEVGSNGAALGNAISPNRQRCILRIKHILSITQTIAAMSQVEALSQLSK